MRVCPRSGLPGTACCYLCPSCLPAASTRIQEGMHSLSGYAKVFQVLPAARLPTAHCLPLVLPCCPADFASLTACPSCLLSSTPGVNPSNFPPSPSFPASSSPFTHSSQLNVLASGVIPQISLIMGPCAGNALLPFKSLRHALYRASSSLHHSLPYRIRPASPLRPFS
ncbi:unnamed protein product [Closterium sp. NIES-54]